MRTGAEHRAALRDGRRVWVMSEGLIDDVTTHPATRAMVDEYVAWYDMHFDPEWIDVLFSPPDVAGARRPWAYHVPKSSDELRGMGRSFAKTTFRSAGNITHTPAYGNLIALGVITAAQEYNAPAEQIANALAYRDRLAATGRFLTFCGGAATIGYRLREDPAERSALRLVRETDAGLVLSGKIGMHTSPAYAEDVYVGALNGIEIGGHRAGFIVEIAAPGVTTVCRKIAVRAQNRFVAPLSSRYDELDGQMWLDQVLIPWERVFFAEASPEPIARWLLWHHLYGWLAKAEFTLGSALALTDAMGLKEHERCRARPAIHFGGLLRPQSHPSDAGRHRAVAGAPAHGRDPAHPARLIAGRRTLRPRSRGSRNGRRAGGIIWRRRVYRNPAFGLIADGLGPRVVGPRRPGIRF